MTPAERRKLKEDRAKLTGYRNRLMLLKDIVPNINVLWHDNSKIVKFFESGEAAKYEAKLKGNTGKPLDKKPKPLKVKTELTVELFKDLKAKGVNDRTIMADYGMHSNQLTAWKKANDLMGISLDGGKPAHKDKQPKPISEVENLAVGAVEVKVDSASEYQKVLDEANLYIKGLEAEVEGLKEHNNKVSSQLEIAQKSERQAIDELIVYQADYRKLEVDYRNQSSELTRVKAMLDKLKRTEQINVWLMEQHVGFVSQLDELVERKAIGY